MLILPLLNAIFAKQTGTPAIAAAFPGGFFRDLAPDGSSPGTAMYMVCTVVSAPQTLKYGGVQRADATIQFTAYGNEHNATGAAIKAFCDVFDDLILTLASGHNANTMRMNEPVPSLDPDKDAQGRDVWAWRVDYWFVVGP